MSTFESLDTNINDPGWWACLNVVLALAHQFRGTTTQDREEDREAWGYFQNALAVSNQLTTMHSTLSSVQALLGISLVILGTPNQGPVSLLTSSAIKQAQRMGLHRRCQEPGLSAVEIEERKRVFWIAYSLDKDISLQTGQPPTQDDDDMDVELPSENNRTLIHPGESNNTDFFGFRARLAIIQGQIYKRLLSVKASKQSATERVIAAKELEAMLQTWRASVPIEFLRDYCGPTLQVPTSDTSRHPVILQLSYFKSLAIIYGSLPILPWHREIQASEDPAELQFMSAPITYATEARKAINLLQVTPRRKYACIW
jgi:Fungal specific transcription factor domain